MDIKKILIAVSILYLISRKSYPGIGKIVSTDFKPRNRIDLYWGDVTPKSWTDSNVPELKNIDVFVDKFNLHGIEFGNWMNQQDRANFLNGAYQSLYHLSKVFSVNQSYLGLKNGLLIGLGSRGMGGKAIAHYDPGVIAINITKTKGPGSLAHEYGHAIDHYSMYSNKKPGYGSGGRSTVKNRRESKSEVVIVYEDIFYDLYYDDKGDETKFVQLLKRTDNYYQRRTEVFARLMERYCHLKLKDMGIRNRFLTNASADIGTPPDFLVWKVEKKLRKLVKLILSK